MRSVSGGKATVSLPGHSGRFGRIIAAGLLFLAIQAGGLVRDSLWAVTTETHETAKPLPADSDGGRIVFQSDRDGDFEIFTVFPDGSGLRQLTFNNARDEYPSWSRDRKTILFQSDRQGVWNLYTMDSAGGDERKLTDGKFNSCSPCWSATGEFIFFDSDELGGWGIYRMNREGGGKIPFKPFRPGERNILASFSPDGQKLVFTTDRGHGWQIALARADGSGERLLGEDGGGCRAHWSPDSRRVVFVSSKRDGKGDIWLMNADGTGERCLTDSPDYDYCPTWSPDGLKIVYATTPDKKKGNWDIVMISVAGGQPIRLIDHPARDNSPCWY